MINYFYIALWIVFFYDAIVTLLLPSSVQFILGTDGSAARLCVNIIAVLIAGYSLKEFGIKKLENGWIIAFILAMIFSHFHSPNVSFESTFLPKDMAIYNYKPMFEVIIFFLMFLGVSSIEFSQISIKNIFKSLCWISVIYSIYIIFQRFGMDQLYKISGEIDHLSRNPEAGGFISQPVFASAFIAMCIPFLIKNKSYWMIAVAGVGIIATGNRSACIAAVITSMMMFKFWSRIGKMLLFSYIGFLALSLVIHCFFPSFEDHFQYSGRLEVWKNLFYDFVNPAFPGINSHYILTGHGLGSFPVFFPFFHHSPFYQAHNELFEMIYCMGILGLIVTFFMVNKFIKYVALTPVSISILSISICAITNAVWHIPQLAFLTVLLIAFTYNKKFGEEYGIQ